MEMNIFHNGQFYTAVIACEKDGNNCYVEYVFGENPDKETLDRFIHHDLLYLIENVKTKGLNDKKVSTRINPKRLQRKVSKERKEAFEERKRMLKRKKAKQKHMGK